jgi:hypothetical protein
VVSLAVVDDPVDAMTEVGQTDVKGLVEVVNKMSRKYTTATIGDVRVAIPTHAITITNGKDTELVLDGSALESLATFVHSPPADYLQSIPGDLAQRIITHHLREAKESEAIFESDGKHLVGVYRAEAMLIDRRRVAEVIERVMGPDARVVRYGLARGSLSADIVTYERTVEPRPGDVTLGGVRFYSHVSPARGKHQQPRVMYYAERLVCSNGQTREESVGQITLKGKTVDEIIEEMETAARRLLDHTVPQRLKQFGELVERPATNPERLVHRLAHENQIGQQIEDRIVEAIPTIEENTYYDVINLVTSFQNENKVRPTQIEKLRAVGGTILGEEPSDRCRSCLHILR